jgi:hypothetical protein
MITARVTCADCYEPFDTLIDEDDDPDLFDTHLCINCEDIRHDLEMEKQRSGWNPFDYN